jgi:hypothetical protein
MKLIKLIISYLIAAATIILLYDDATESQIVAAR